MSSPTATFTGDTEEVLHKPWQQGAPTTQGRNSKKYDSTVPYTATLHLASPNLITFIQRKPTQHIQQRLIIIWLHIPPLLIQSSQIIRNIPAIKLPHLKPIPHKRKHILPPILDLIIFIPRRLHHLQKMQSTARPNSSLAVRPPLLEPTSTRRGPRRALQEEIRVLAEL